VAKKKLVGVVKQRKWLKIEGWLYKKRNWLEITGWLRREIG
jgi:hypothetical protein